MINTILVTKDNVSEYLNELDDMDNNFSKELKAQVPKHLVDSVFTSSNKKLKDIIFKYDNVQWYVITTKEDDMVVGFIVLDYIGQGIVNIESIYIKPKYRKGGYGQEVLFELRKMIKDLKKFKAITVRVYTTNKAALGLYQKVGFEPWFEELHLKV